MTKRRAPRARRRSVVASAPRAHAPSKAFRRSARPTSAAVRGRAPSAPPRVGGTKTAPAVWACHRTDDLRAGHAKNRQTRAMSTIGRLHLLARGALLRVRRKRRERTRVWSRRPPRGEARARASRRAARGEARKRAEETKKKALLRRHPRFREPRAHGGHGPGSVK